MLLWLVAATFAWADTPKPTVDDFGWLAGRWRLEQDGRVVHEEWMAPAGGVMLGMSRTLKDGRLRDYEFVVLRADETGDIYYEAKPSGQAGARFKLVKLEGRSALFEDKGHDFPQRIGYTLNADGSLTAWIEGEIGDKSRRIDYPYRRAE